MTIPQRFEDKIERVTECGCWIWMGATDGNGYGRFGLNGKNTRAHRVSYECIIGPIPDGLQIDHLCRIKCCVNPYHLEPVTNAKNVQRAWDARGKNLHCIKGHAIDGVNNWRRGTTCRQCVMDAASLPEARAKKNAAERARYRRRKENAS